MNHLRQHLKNLEDQPIILGNELGKGGEGSVFAIHHSPHLAVKIYHHPLPPEKAEKILAMIRLGNERLFNLSTWPLSPYYSESGILSGFIMSRLTNHYPLYELYNPKLRLNTFPKADWRFLVHAAANVARAFEVMHQAGHVIGDVNHGNLLVAHDATVRFIDTDSFQIMDDKENWFCEVGVSTHQPPEMQGLPSFKGVLRSPNHDNFGLAVLIFQLLFLARHPFSGRFLGTGDMPLEKAIAEHRFAFGSNNTSLQMLPPPVSLSIDALTPHLRLLFERAFSRDSSGVQVGLRPTPDEWITGLTTLSASLVSCFSNAGHYYLQGLNTCPWCDMEAKSGSPLFLFVNAENSTSIDIQAIWQQVLTVKNPGPEPPLPSLTAHTVPPSKKAHAVVKQLKSLMIYYFVFWCMILFTTIHLRGTPWTGLCVLVALFYPVATIFHYDRRKRPLAKELLADHEDILKNWEYLINRMKATHSSNAFKKLRQHIDRLIKAYQDFGTNNEQLNLLINQKSYKDQFSPQEVDEMKKEIITRRKQMIDELTSAAFQLSAFPQHAFEHRKRLASEASHLLTRYSQTIADAQSIKLRLDE